MKLKTLIPQILFALALTCATSLQAAVKYLTVNNGTTLGYNGVCWGTPAVVPVAGTDYIVTNGLAAAANDPGMPTYTSQARCLDSALTSDTVFIGNSLTLSNNCRLVIKS